MLASPKSPQTFENHVRFVGRALRARRKAARESRADAHEQAQWPGSFVESDGEDASDDEED